MSRSSGAQIRISRSFPSSTEGLFLKEKEDAAASPSVHDQERKSGYAAPCWRGIGYQSQAKLRNLASSTMPACNAQMILHEPWWAMIPLIPGRILSGHEAAKKATDSTCRRPSSPPNLCLALGSFLPGSTTAVYARSLSSSSRSTLKLNQIVLQQTMHAFERTHLLGSEWAGRRMS